jgi:hypothetical protein
MQYNNSGPLMGGVNDAIHHTEPSNDTAISSRGHNVMPGGTVADGNSQRSEPSGAKLRTPDLVCVPPVDAPTMWKVMLPSPSTP